MGVVATFFFLWLLSIEAVDECSAPGFLDVCLSRPDVRFDAIDAFNVRELRARAGPRCVIVLRSLEREREEEKEGVRPLK